MSDHRDPGGGLLQTSSQISLSHTMPQPSVVSPLTMIRTATGWTSNGPSGSRKRKLTDLSHDIAARRRRIVQHKAVRLKRLRKDYVDQVQETLTLEGCTLADVYKKRPLIPALLNYFKNNPLDSSDPNEDLISLVEPVQQQSDTKASEVLTPIVTPAAVPSTSTPVPKPPVPAVLPEPPLTPSRLPSPAASTSRSHLSPYDTSLTSQEQIVEKAKQEAQVMQRIGELQREGLWTEKRLPKVQEPPRAKAHWDYLIEEMVWMAADFAQERKWKKAAAKKCAKMVQKYFQDKEAMAQKAVKSQEMQLKRIASCMAKEIKQFWANVEKLVDYKQQTRLEEKRKKALDQHLSFIVDQTEKYSSLVAESMNKTGLDSVGSSRAPSPTQRQSTAASDGEFEPGGTSSDDEETIARAEAEEEKDEGSVDKAKEIELLKRESELPLEDLLKDYLDNRESMVLDDDTTSSLDKEDEKDEEFHASNKDSSDDEETIQEQEKTEGKVDHKQELDDLKAEGEMSIEELKAKYVVAQSNGAPPVEVDGSKSEEEESLSSSEEEDDEIMEVDEDGASAGDLSTLLADDPGSHKPSDKDVGDKEINDVAAIAESLQPKGNTLSSTSVVTKIPFLLKHTLREYQHIGLDWLVTMHDRKLNGILADEMGLGKTIQTISVLAHLACDKGVWGPHLIVVPTSVMLNWEMEFKKWCPAFKILTYYGTQKERKLKRTGWTKPNAFHVCITSYKLVIQDHNSFRRKSWKYLILDEAQNIKNFKSQRWQLLLNFQTQRRLLLTGTPLQNNLMELWSLMHFLMPNVFQSHREFKEWFSNPVTGMIEGNSEYNDQIIKRLHKVLRPFLLRRLKSEVEKQLPKKYEHVVMCRLSNRQRYLYEDFMSRAKTKETLASGNLLSVINVLMQLRKVCNHPNLFEVRPIVSPFQMEGLGMFTASCVSSALDYDPFKQVDLFNLNGLFADLELWLSAWMAHRTHTTRTPALLIQEIDSAPPPPPPCPRGRIKVHVNSKANSTPSLQVPQMSVRPGIVGSPRTLVSTSLVPRLGPTSLVRTAIANQVVAQGLAVRVPGQPGQLQMVQWVQPQRGTAVKVAVSTTSGSEMQYHLVHTSSGQHVLVPSSTTLNSPTSVMTSGGHRVVLGPGTPIKLAPCPTTSLASSSSTSTSISPSSASSATTPTTPQILSPLNSPAVASLSPSPSTSSTSLVTRSLAQAKRKFGQENTVASEFTLSRLEEKRRKWRESRLERLGSANEQRCCSSPMYGWDLVQALRLEDPGYWHRTDALAAAVFTVDDRLRQLHYLLTRFVVAVPAACAPRPSFHVSHPPPWKLHSERRLVVELEHRLGPLTAPFHHITAATLNQFPDPSLVQYDCGKLQTLDRLLRRLKSQGHRILIFTQMTRMLDVLEAFLNYHGHIYLRLDGTTKVDQRQVLMERFNGDKRIFCFILSTRSGGVGVNLTGADTVIFYDSDWNPTMDAQAQDRCHRIGQTRDVHIYRLVSEKTVEENILKKANQKRMLGDLAIEGGNFTTAYFKSSTIQDLFSVDVNENDASRRMAEVLERDSDKRALPRTEEFQNGAADDKAALGVLESALAAAEDEPDVTAARTAHAEAVADLAEFDESIPLDENGDGEEISKAEQEVNALIQQLSGVERYAMRFLEETEAAWSAEQLAAAEAEIEQQKHEWEEERMAALRLQAEQDERDTADAVDELLTYSREDAQNQIWISQNAKEQMPMWCPPTPPADDTDVYIDQTLCFLYEQSTMSEAQLPPVYVKKERKRARVEAIIEGRPQVKLSRSQHREEVTLVHAPRSLFDRPSPALLKMRHDLRLAKYRGTGVRPPVFTLQPSSVTKPAMPLKPPNESEHVPEWLVHEDWAILQAVQVIQELTLHLLVVCPGHTPNWDMVADMVNMVSRVHRSPRQCRNRYEYVIIPREEGKMMFDANAKKQKKTKGLYKLPQTKCSRPMKTSQMYLQDNNSSFTQVMNAKFDSIKAIAIKRTPTMKPMLNNKPDLKNPKHAEVLSGCGIDYEQPLSPVSVATRRQDRITKEKQMAAQQAQQQQLALLRSQIGVTVPGGTINKTIATQVAGTKPIIQVPLTVQDLVVGRAATPGPSATVTQRIITTASVTTATTTATTNTMSSPTTKVMASTKLSPAQLQLYQRQALLQRQQQLKAAALQGRTTIAMAQPTHRIQQVKNIRASESDVAALLKATAAVRGQGTGTVTVAGKSLSSAQILTQQPGQMATLVKATPLTAPQVKAVATGVKTTTATPQQIRQLTLQNQALLQQRSKHKVTQLGQVMVTNKGVPTQLIVQSQKTPTTMTMQQIQQVIKHAHPQQITHVSTGSVNVSQGSSGQVISHAVIAKSQAGSSQSARVIPHQNIKQTIQVVTASPGVRTAVPNVTMDASGRPTVSVAGAIGTIKVSSQQALINQVTAAFQQGQQIAMRQAPVRIQTTGGSAPLVAVAVTQAPTLLTLTHPQHQQQQHPPDNAHNQ